MPCRVELTQGLFALVDAVDFENVSKFKWCAHKERQKFYAVTNVPENEIKCFGKTQIRMHQLILGAASIDHINGNGLDNRRCNIRICTSAQNNSNRRKMKGSSVFKGVYFDRDKNKWVAQIKKNRRPFYLGSFKSESDAAVAYNKKAAEFFGSFALLNEVAA